MTYNLKKKLLHFETTGSSIAEDFIAARRGKVRALRKRIRVCFYVHCIAVLMCIAAAAIIGTVPDIIEVSVCAAASIVFAVSAVGDRGSAKTLACVIDAAMLLAAAALAIFGRSSRLLYILCAVLMLAALGSIILMSFYGSCKKFLEDYSPLSIRRDDYTLLNEVGYKLYTGAHAPVKTTSANANVNDGVIQPLPPLTSEMRELAGKVCEILLANEKKLPEIHDSVSRDTHIANLH